MYRIHSLPIALVAALAMGLMLGGCGAAKKAGRIGSSSGNSLASNDGCNMNSARSHALRYLDKAAAVRARHPVRAAQYEYRASEVISAAEACQKRRGY